MTFVTVTGRLADDPILKYSDYRKVPYCTFTVIERHRFRGEDGRWHTEAAKFHDVTIWRNYGLNVAESLRKGQHVIVTGNQKQINVTGDDGKIRSKEMIDAKDVAVTLRDGKIEVKRPPKQSTAGNYGGDDPWAAS